MSKIITVKTAKTALRNLRKLTPANPKIDDDLTMSVKEAVFYMAPDLIRMSKLGFTKKELSDSLAAEGIAVKSGTLNRYLTEYQDAKKEPEKSQADFETCKAEIVTEKTGLENPKSCWENPKSDGHAAGEKSDSPPEDQGVSHAGK